MSLSLDWRPRGENTEADDLTNSDFSGFAAENRLCPSLADLKFLLLPDLLKHGTEFLRETEALRTERPLPRLVKRKRATVDRLAVRDPW